MTDTDNRPWNADRAVGPREHFSPPESWDILHQLQLNENWHDCALLTVGIDSLLRCVDLLNLQVRDVTDRYGRVTEEIYYRQKKTKHTVGPTLTPKAIEALQKWIRVSGKKPHHYLFTRTKAIDGPPIGDSAFRDAIKWWASLIQLDPTPYSTHSLRRTKPHFMFREGVDIAYISELLGHKDTSTTLRYLGITLEEARYFAQKHDLWKKSARRKSTKLNLNRSHKSIRPVDYDVFEVGLQEILNRLKTLEASNEKILSKIESVESQNDQILGCIKTLLTSSPKPNREKD